MEDNHELEEILATKLLPTREFISVDLGDGISELLDDINPARCL